MKGADVLKASVVLFMSGIVANGGVFVEKCQQPLECMQFAECSTDEQRNSDVIFICNETKHSGVMLCCHSQPLQVTTYNNSSANRDQFSVNILVKLSAEILISKRNPNVSISMSSYSPNELDKLETDTGDNYANRRNVNVYSNNTLPAVESVLNASTVIQKKNSENSPKDSYVPTPPVGSQESYNHASTEPSNILSPATVNVSYSQDVDEKMRLLPLEDCGVSTTLRITNGQNASFGQFPWMVLLGYRLRDGTLSFLCGGSLISKRYILTAAHCLDPDDAILEEVRLGEHNLDTELDCDETEGYCADPVVDIPIEAAIPHEKFNSPYLKNDIALLRLQTPINISTDYIRPICLPFGLNVTGLEEKKYQIAGWGKTDYYNTDGSRMLQFTGIFSVPLQECDARQEKEVRPLDETQFCAGADMGKDACKGDSGGPLMETLQAPSQSTIQTFLIGVVSFGSVPCGAKYSPSVYTRVTAFLDWILNKIEP